MHLSCQRPTPVRAKVTQIVEASRPPRQRINLFALRRIDQQSQADSLKRQCFQPTGRTLLSSITLFMFSIQSASTGPSKRIHFWSGLSSVKSNEIPFSIVGRFIFFFNRPAVSGSAEETKRPKSNGSVTGTGFPHDRRYNAVVPFPAGKIVVPVKLAEAERLRINRIDVDDVEPGLLVVPHASHRVLQHAPRDRLCCVRLAHYHRRVSRVHRLVQLDNFRQYQGNRL